MYFIKSSSKPYWKFKSNIKLIFKIILFFDIKIKNYFKIDVFYFDQFLHNLSNQFFKNLILIFKGIKIKYLYVYQTNFI
jgi:hypothetical protein